MEEGSDALTSPSTERDVLTTRNQQQLLAQHRQFIRQFPFDVINLDLEQYLFRPKEELPGQLIRALRKIFYWQTKALTAPQGRNQGLNSFSLMFTTQIGPPNLTNDYLNMLRDRLTANLDSYEELRPLLVERTGLDNVEVLRDTQFNNFFKLAMPKILAATLMEEDWYIDSEAGVVMFEFDRPSKDGPYQMLHLVMDVQRKRPPRDRRPPGADSAEAQVAYREVVRQIFSRRETVVTLESINQRALQEDLNRIKARRRLYYPDEETP